MRLLGTALEPASRGPGAGGWGTGLRGSRLGPGPLGRRLPGTAPRFEAGLSTQDMPTAKATWRDFFSGQCKEMVSCKGGS